MTEGTYEYECMRAELLGIKKPDYEEFMKTEAEKMAVEDEEVDTENLKDADLQEETEKRILGGLEELNSLLQKTQGKITKFKASCGSLTNLLKIKVTGKSDSSSPVNDNPTTEGTQVAPGENVNPTNENGTTGKDAVEEKGENEEKQRKSDLAKALDNDLSRLDAMIEKAEHAQYSMAHQSKQMKHFLK